MVGDITVLCLNLASKFSRYWYINNADETTNWLHVCIAGNYASFWGFHGGDSNVDTLPQCYRRSQLRRPRLEVGKYAFHFLLWNSAMCLCCFINLRLLLETLVSRLGKVSIAYRSTFTCKPFFLYHMKPHSSLECW